MRTWLRIFSDYMLCIRARLKQISCLVWATLIGILVASNGTPTFLSLSLILLATFAMAAAMYLYNDIMDYDIDKINKVDRPIARDVVSKNDAASLVLLLSAFAIILSLLMNTQSLLFCTTFLALGFLYSAPYVRLRDRFMAKQTIPATGALICNLIGGTAVGKTPPSLIYAAILFFLLSFAGAPLGDLADIKGDREKGARTFAVVFGPSFTIKLSIAIFLLISIVTAVSFSSFGFNILTPILVTAASLAFSWISFSLLKNWQSPEYCIGTYKKLVLSLFLFQISFLFGIL